MSSMQSVLDPQGPEAAAITTLAWVMFGGGAAICLAVAGLVVMAMGGGASVRRAIASERFVVWTGIVVPTVVLAALLAWGLVLTGGRNGAASPQALSVEITGEQWWWRIRYLPGTPDAVETANELTLPVGRDVELRLVSRDVIHSFWVPSLAGKVDMIPGTVNRLRLRASRAGVYRGQCAEYCGGPHALMSFHAVALEAQEFDSWLANQRRPATAPADADAMAGRTVFLKAGCHGCHTVRGLEATGIIGPDLTHVASRLTLGAATLPNDRDHFRRWVRDNQHLKPGNRMPSFGFLAERDLDQLAAWLGSLK
jgi:cytochrome c oxidase subunit 2